MVSGKCKVQNGRSTVLPVEWWRGERQRICYRIYHVPVCAQTLEGHKKLCTLLPPCRGAEWDRNDLALYILLYL